MCLDLRMLRFWKSDTHTDEEHHLAQFYVPDETHLVNNTELQSLSVLLWLYMCNGILNYPASSSPPGPRPSVPHTHTLLWCIRWWICLHLHAFSLFSRMFPDDVWMCLFLRLWLCCREASRDVLKVLGAAESSACLFSCSSLRKGNDKQLW